MIFFCQAHYFAATGGTGRQVYGTCLTVWEPYDLKMTLENGNNKAHSATSNDCKVRHVLLPKCLVLLSTYPYLAAFREFLSQLHRLSKLGEMTLPIERYISNFCSEIPAPPPGSFEVQTTILDSVIKIWSPPHNLPIPWVSLPFAHLFECLDIENVILVWHCLVLERQVLITSTQISLLTSSCEIFLSLLFPMRWSHAYIPVLPHFLIPILSAPMPFLCGIIKTNLADALYDLSRDCVLVDLDKNTVTLGPDTLELPPIPPYQEALLHTQLEENAGMVFREARSLTRSDDYSDSGQNLQGHVKQMAEAMWESKLMLYDEAFHLIFTPEQSRKNILNGNDASGMDSHERDLGIMPKLRNNNSEGSVRKQSAWDAVQEAFLDTFVYLLRNYRKYLVFPSKHNEGSYGGAGFRSKEFIESQRYDMRGFLHQLVGSQMFDNFITKRLYGSGEADVSFFDTAVDQFLKNAGMFADVDISGRLTSGFSKAKQPGRNSVRSASRSIMLLPPGATVKEDPLIQSARVHRKLKTIVPPEPTGEGLPENAPQLVMKHVKRASVSVSGSGTLSRSATFSDDDESTSTPSAQGSTLVNSAQGSTLVKPSPNRPVSRPKKTAQELAAEIMVKKKGGVTYTYGQFPSKFIPELFGTPRPLSAAVIAEFDRQRKDAAQFKRKALHKKDNSATGDQKSQHIQRAHATVDASQGPPSPEVATFTVFFMAFTGLVGKELMDMSCTQGNDKTILSNYVPVTSNDVLSDDGLSDDGDGLSVTDEEEKANVAAMKSSRPPIEGILGDDDDETSRTDASTASRRKDEDGTSSVESDKHSKGKSRSVDDDDNTTVKTEDSKPRERFHDKISVLQIEEAKAKGRAQLGLAFEMLTMMKKRALKADPEAYQCLIDACGRVGDTKRATELLAKMHEDGIVADGTVYACLVSAFSAESAWKDTTADEDLPEWANSTAVDMDWNRLQKRSFLDRMISQVVDLEDEDGDDEEETAYQKLRRRISNYNKEPAKPAGKNEDKGMEFFVTETVERQISLGENLLEIVFPDIAIDTENEICPRCNFTLSDDDVVVGWTPGHSNDYTTACPNCTQRFVPHFCVQSSATNFVGSRGVETPLMCERLSPWVLQKEIRSVMSDDEGTANLLSPTWREKEYKNSVLWWNVVLSCMRYRFPFSFLLQGSFDQNLIAPTPED